jgi:hypothetical protein
MSSTKKTAQYTEYGWPSCQSILDTAVITEVAATAVAAAAMAVAAAATAVAATAAAATAVAVVSTTAAAGLESIWVEYPKGALARARSSSNDRLA